MKSTQKLNGIPKIPQSSKPHSKSLYNSFSIHKQKQSTPSFTLPNENNLNAKQETFRHVETNSITEEQIADIYYTVQDSPKFQNHQQNNIIFNSNDSQIKSFWKNSSMQKMMRDKNELSISIGKSKKIYYPPSSIQQTVEMMNKELKLELQEQIKQNSNLLQQLDDSLLMINSRDDEIRNLKEQLQIMKDEQAAQQNQYQNALLTQAEEFQNQLFLIQDKCCEQHQYMQSQINEMEQLKQENHVLEQEKLILQNNQAEILSKQVNEQLQLHSSHQKQEKKSQKQKQKFSVDHKIERKENNLLKRFGKGDSKNQEKVKSLLNQEQQDKHFSESLAKICIKLNQFENNETNQIN